MAVNAPFVLSIEDSEADFTLMAMALRDCLADVEVRRIHDGEKALAFFRELAPAMRPDLVFLDLNLPCCSGFEVLAFMRSVDVFHETPVVMFTSSRSVNDRNKALELGANEYISKPLGLDPMLAILDGLCARYLVKASGGMARAASEGL